MNIEEIIRRAQSEGRFDDLPGKGKPLDLSKRAPADVVSTLVKESGFVPAWVALGKEIDSSADAIAAIRERWMRYRTHLREQAADLLPRCPADARQLLRRIARERDQVAADLALRWTRDQRAAKQYNLIVPTGGQQRIVPDPDRLLRAFLEASPDAAVATGEPARIIDVPAAVDVPAVLATAREQLAAEDAPRGSRMNSLRAEALIGFKNKMAGKRF